MEKEKKEHYYGEGKWDKWNASVRAGKKVEEDKLKIALEMSMDAHKKEEDRMLLLALELSKSPEGPRGKVEPTRRGGPRTRAPAKPPAKAAPLPRTPARRSAALPPAKKTTKTEPLVAPKPPPAPKTSKAEYDTQLAQLAAMGFTDTVALTVSLITHKGNVEAVLAALLG